LESLRRCSAKRLALATTGAFCLVMFCFFMGPLKLFVVFLLLLLLVRWFVRFSTFRLSGGFARRLLENDINK